MRGARAKQIRRAARKVAAENKAVHRAMARYMIPRRVRVWAAVRRWWKALWYPDGGTVAYLPGTERYNSRRLKRVWNEASRRERAA